MMKLSVTLTSNTGKIILPVHYNHLVQAAIYQLLNPAFASFLHEHGYIYKKRQFRLFSFSRLMGEYKLDRKHGMIIFANPIKLIILSPLKVFSEDVINSLMLGKCFRLGSKMLEVSEIAVDFPKVADNEVRIRTLSPIVSYSTIERQDGGKFTRYFEPAESEFGRLVSLNLFKKLKAWDPNWMVPEEEFHFFIKPVGRIRRNLVMYKSNVIKGYSGVFLLKGEPKYLEFALNVGLGSKGAQGFGAIELFNN